MSAREDVGGHVLRLARREAGGYWVRLAATGRTLGVIAPPRRGCWSWSVWGAAFRGDGRTGRERDGDSLDTVPASLRLSGEARTRRGACGELVDCLTEHEAPVMGFGPHAGVERRKAGCNA